MKRNQNKFVSHREIKNIYMIFTTLKSFSFFENKAYLLSSYALLFNEQQQNCKTLKLTGDFSIKYKVLLIFTIRHKLKYTVMHIC